MAPRSRLLLNAACVALASAVVIAVNACGSTQRCGHECNGCCDESGRCQIGTITSACGINGNLCITCGLTDICNLGVCVPTSPGGGGDGGGGTPGKDAGLDAGTDAGGGVDGGGNDAGPGDAGMSDGGSDGGVTPMSYTIAQLRAANPVNQLVRLSNVIVRDVSSTTFGDGGDYRVEFWVTDPNNAKAGLWIEKFYTDTPTTYNPQPGDHLSIDGWYGSIAGTNDRKGYRESLRNEFALGGQGKLAITVLTPASATLPPNVTAGVFGNALAGTAKPNADYAGARVHINGPLTLTNPNPTAMQRLNAGTVQGYNGFEVTGGILVNNYKTFGSGPGRCDYRVMVLDGGTVTFPNGISGVWDTYTHAPCLDTLNPCTRATGSVPGTSNDYTYVLYPQDCANDLPGVVQ